MLYGGSALASALDRLSDAFRTALAPPAPAAPACHRLTLVYGDLSAADAPEIGVGHADGEEQTATPEPAHTTQAPVAEHPSPGRADSEAETVGAADGNEAPPFGSPAPAWPRAAFGLAKHHRPCGGIPRTVAHHPHGAPIPHSGGAQVPDSTICKSLIGDVMGLPEKQRGSCFCWLRVSLRVEHASSKLLRSVLRCSAPCSVLRALWPQRRSSPPLLRAPLLRSEPPCRCSVPQRRNSAPLLRAPLLRARASVPQQRNSAPLLRCSVAPLHWAQLHSSGTKPARPVAS